jgi:hypothetical protein
LGVSRQGEFKNAINKYEKNKSDPSPFLASDPPTHHRGHRFFFNWRWRPLDARCTVGPGPGHANRTQLLLSLYTSVCQQSANPISGVCCSVSSSLHYLY